MRSKLPKSSRLVPLVLGAVLLAVSSADTLAISQPVPGRPTPVDGPSDADREAAARERARRTVEARLQDIRAEQARLEQTLAAIDAGEPLQELDIPRRSERGAGPEGDRERRDGDRDREGTPEESFTDEEVKAFIAEVYPEWMERIRELEARDPNALQRLLRDRRPRLVELMVERRDHPAVFDAKQKFFRSEMMIRRVAWSFASAEDDRERREAEAKLETLIGEQFDLRIGILEAELAEVESDAAEKREEIADARENRESMIAERKADLIRAIRERRQDPRRDDSPGRPDRPGRPGPDRPDGPPRR